MEKIVERQECVCISPDVEENNDYYLRNDEYHIICYGCGRQSDYYSKSLDGVDKARREWRANTTFRQLGS